MHSDRPEAVTDRVDFHDRIPRCVGDQKLVADAAANAADVLEPHRRPRTHVQVAIDANEPRPVANDELVRRPRDKTFDPAELRVFRDRRVGRAIDEQQPVLPALHDEDSRAVGHERDVMNERNAGGRKNEPSQLSNVLRALVTTSDPRMRFY